MEKRYNKPDPGKGNVSLNPLRTQFTLDNGSIGPAYSQWQAAAKRNPVFELAPFFGKDANGVIVPREILSDNRK